LPDFYSLLDAGNSYEDTEFGHSSHALYWTEAGEGNGNFAVNKEQWITWRRATDISGNHTLFGDNGIVDPNDINQGWIGNCWFLSAASAIAEKPGRFESIFLNNDNELNSAGIYGVNFYTLGVPHTIIIDDWLPLEQLWDGSYTTLFAHVGDGSSIWGALIEKAFAKYHGNYEHIVGGAPAVAARTLHGGPSDNLWHADYTMEQVWAKLVEHDGKDDILQAGTPGNDDSTTNSDGLVQGHAYVVLGVTTLNNGQRLVQLRNPWGKDSYKGDYSDYSGRWTAALQEELGYSPDTEDGRIWMTIEDYYNQVEETYINFDVTNWHSAHFLKLNDQSQA